MTGGKIRVGTSGWSYDHWRDLFYPHGTTSGRRLGYYATRLSTVEINATFYRTQSEATMRRWAAEVPPGFAFSAKGSRFVTHYRRLHEAGDSVRLFMERAELLGPALEVVLWQLPPNLGLDADTLNAFCTSLPTTVRHAVEFRDRSWLVPAAFEVLAQHGIADVAVDSDRMPADCTVTADFVYLRFHGRTGYHGDYTPPQLEPWADFLREQARDGRDGYVYFNNDAEGHAPVDAERLVQMLGEDAYRWPVSQLP